MRALQKSLFLHGWGLTSGRVGPCGPGAGEAVRRGWCDAAAELPCFVSVEMNVFEGGDLSCRAVQN